MRNGFPTVGEANLTTAVAARHDQLLCCDRCSRLREDLTWPWSMPKHWVRPWPCWYLRAPSKFIAIITRETTSVLGVHHFWTNQFVWCFDSHWKKYQLYLACPQTSNDPPKKTLRLLSTGAFVMYHPPIDLTIATLALILHLFHVEPKGYHVWILVGGFNPSENYESTNQLSQILRKMWKNRNNIHPPIRISGPTVITGSPCRIGPSSSSAPWTSSLEQVPTLAARPTWVDREWWASWCTSAGSRWHRWAEVWDRPNAYLEHQDVPSHRCHSQVADMSLVCESCEGAKTSARSSSWQILPPTLTESVGTNEMIVEGWHP